MPPRVMVGVRGQGRSLLPDARIVEHEVKAKSVAVEGLSDVGLAIGPQQVESEMAQPCKEGSPQKTENKAR